MKENAGRIVLLGLPRSLGEGSNWLMVRSGCGRSLRLGAKIGSAKPAGS